MSNTQELCRFDRSGVLNGGPKGRQNTKSRNFLRKKLQKWGFRLGGQTAPSEPAPRVGSGGDVLAGLLPSHSNNPANTSKQLKRKKWSGRSFLGPTSAHAEKSFRVGFLYGFLHAPLTPINFFVIVSEVQNKVAAAKMF